jgi:cytochrome P450
MFYLLGRHRDEAVRLHDELDLVLGGRPPELADLERLPCVEWALLESMRLYPPAWTVARGVARPFMARGYRVPSGSVVLLSQWVMHRHPAWFVDPLRFDPGRWSPPRRGEIPRLAYFPFGAGPRVCIGETFAWNEAVLVAATLARRWRLELVQDSEVDPVARLTLRPGRRIPVITRLRTRPWGRGRLVSPG